MNLKLKLKMKNYSSRINKIKDTLGEIKNNIKKFQLVNKYSII